MSRYRIKESTLKTKSINPVWRGIGCVFLVLMTLGGYWLAGWVIDANYFPLPTDMVIHVGKYFDIPGRVLIQLGATLMLDVMFYGVMVVFWAILNPPKLGPHDAPPVRGTGRRSLDR
jgi:hypothetical protein